MKEEKLLELGQLADFNYKERTTNFTESFNSKCIDLSLHPEPFLEILSTNPSKNLPYHNNNHLIDVAYDANLIGSLHGLTATLRRTLFVAGLFHDFNHTGIAKPDQNNINLAIASLVQNEQLVEKERLDMETLQSFIQTTCTDNNLAHLTPAGFICDADLLAWCYRDPNAQCLALSTEQGVVNTIESSTNFFANISFYSSAVSELFSKKWGI